MLCSFIKNSKNTRILVGIIFLKILEFSKYKNMNSFYNSKNLYEIFRKFLKISILVKKILSFIQKIQNAIAKQNSGISRIFEKLQSKKKFDCTCFILVL